MTDAKLCGWCRESIPTQSAQGRARRVDSDYCGRKCRQAAHRLRKRLGGESDASPGAGEQRQNRRPDRDDASPVTAAPGDTSRPMRLAYADPPYPGRARRYYGGDGDPYAGEVEEVDHAQLIGDLEREYPDGWALSTAADALRDVLPLCPPDARVCAWVKPHAPGPRTHGIHNCWEPLIVCRGRQEAPGKRDWLNAHAARLGGSTLPGRKPIAFVAWLFTMLGADPLTDDLVDLFPGTGVVGRAWANLQREASRAAGTYASTVASADASLTARAQLFDAEDLELAEASLGAAAIADASRVAQDLEPSPQPGADDATERAA